MREKVTGTEYFMALSLAGSEGPQPRAGPGCVCQGALALTVQEMRQEQTPQAGGELLTEIDEPSYLGTARRCLLFFFFPAFSSRISAFCLYLLVPGNFYREGSLFKLSQTDFPSHVDGTEVWRGWKMAWSTC